MFDPGEPDWIGHWTRWQSTPRRDSDIDQLVHHTIAQYPLFNVVDLKGQRTRRGERRYTSQSATINFRWKADVCPSLNVNLDLDLELISSLLPYPPFFWWLGLNLHRADEKSVKEFGIESGSTLHLVLALRGGSGSNCVAWTCVCINVVYIAFDCLAPGLLSIFGSESLSLTSQSFKTCRQSVGVPSQRHICCLPVWCKFVLDSAFRGIQRPRHTALANLRSAVRNMGHVQVDSYLCQADVASRGSRKRRYNPPTC